MSEEISLTIREAQPNDASELLAMMQQVEEETDFLVMDEQGMELTPEALALSIEYLQDSNNNLLLLACMGQKIIGVVSVKAGEQYRISHVGEVGISILKDYWDLG